MIMCANTSREERKKEQARRKEDAQQLPKVNLTLLREDTWAYGRGRVGDEWRNGKERAKERGEEQQWLSKQGKAMGKMNKQDRRSKALSSILILSSPKLLLRGHLASSVLDVKRAC